VLPRVSRIRGADAGSASPCHKLPARCFRCRRYVTAPRRTPISRMMAYFSFNSALPECQLGVPLPPSLPSPPSLSLSLSLCLHFCISVSPWPFSGHRGTSPASLVPPPARARESVKFSRPEKMAGAPAGESGTEEECARASRNPRRTTENLPRGDRRRRRRGGGWYRCSGWI